MLRTAARGYDRAAVDDVLGRCVAALGERAGGFPELAGRAAALDLPTLDAGDVRALRFEVVRGGYDVAQVDALLARLAAALPAEEARPRWRGDPLSARGTGSGPGLHLALRGYDREQVDAFLVRCAHSLADRVDEVPELAPLLGRPRTGAPLRARDVETAQFPLRLRGYAIAEVDALLDRVAAALDRRRAADDR